MAVGRWPLAVGRWPLAVGRWPLAVGLSLGVMCAFNVPIAHAGQWEIVPLARYPFGYYSPEQEATPAYKSWLAEARKRYEGQNTFQESEPPKGQSYPVGAAPVERQHLDKLPMPFYPINAYSADTKNGTMYWWNSPNHIAGAYSIGGAASVAFSGQTSVVLRYFPDYYNDDVDLPVDPVFLKVTVDATAGATDGYEPGQIRNSGKEHAQLTVTPKGEVPANATVISAGSEIDTGTGKALYASTSFYVKFSPKGKTTKDASGYITATVPLVSVDLKAWLDANRSTQQSDSYGWNRGSVGVKSQGTATVAPIGLFLSRAGARASTSRSDPNFNADRDEYVDADGVRHGHTTYSYMDIYALDFREEHPNRQNFSVSVAVPNGVTGDWQWQSASSGDTQQSHSEAMPYGSMNKSIPPAGFGSPYWTGTPTTDQQHVDVSYSFTNSSLGIELKKQYQLTLHDEWEIKEQIGATDPQCIVDTWYPFPAWSSHSAKDPEYGVSYDKSVTQEYKKTVSKGSSASITAGFDASKIAPWLTGKGISLDAKGEASIAVASEQTTTSKNSQGLTYTVKPVATIRPGWEGRPAIQVLAKRERFKLWQWNEGGFVAESVLTVDTTDETPYRPDWEYREITSPNPGGTG